MEIHKKLIRWVELVVIYIGIPLLYYWDCIPVHKLAPLGVVFFVYLIIVLRDKSFKRHKFRLNGFKAWNMIFYRTAITVVFLLMYVWTAFPDQLFRYPAEQTWFWVSLLILYPLWSVIPQEFVYRVYFYHRFKHIIKDRNTLVLLNAVLFSFLHIIFHNWVAITLTFVAGIIFSLTYLRYRSFSITVLEHVIYGSLIFTIGPGDFFYIHQL